MVCLCFPPLMTGPTNKFFLCSHVWVGPTNIKLVKETNLTLVTSGQPYRRGLTLPPFFQSVIFWVVDSQTRWWVWRIDYNTRGGGTSWVCRHSSGHPQGTGFQHSDVLQVHSSETVPLSGDFTNKSSRLCNQTHSTQ
jgi:hypothetical protein